MKMAALEKERDELLISDLSEKDEEQMQKETELIEEARYQSWRTDNDLLSLIIVVSLLELL